MAVELLPVNVQLINDTLSEYILRIAPSSLKSVLFLKLQVMSVVFKNGVMGCKLCCKISTEDPMPLFLVKVQLQIVMCFR